jgi:hypothetical protein
MAHRVRTRDTFPETQMAKTIRFMELLGGTCSFQEAFSDLEEALIQYYEIGDGIETIRGFPPSGTYTNPHQVKQPRMRCSNNRCKRGGYDIEQEIRNMTYGKVTEREFILHCEGDEGSPKGRKKGPTVHEYASRSAPAQVQGREVDTDSRAAEGKRD